MGFLRWITKALNVESTSIVRRDHRSTSVADEHADEIYSSWLSEHPSALASFKEMMKMAWGKRIVVFLDYDGTLSPIVSDPDRAFMSDQMRRAVHEVSRHFPTAIISGRSRKKVHEFVKLNEVYYAGSHGMDIMGPPPQQGNNSLNSKYQARATNEKGEEFIIFQPAQEFRPEIEKMIQELKEKTRKIGGAMIEDNSFCISVHYRHVHQQEHENLEEQVGGVLSNYPGFHLTRGKKVLEIRPSIKWNKGDALEYLMDTLGFDILSGDVLPIYIGDDTTDEDAFKVLGKRGVGYPIIVSSKPRETAACYSLYDTSEVLSFLIRLARWSSANYPHY